MKTTKHIHLFLTVLLTLMYLVSSFGINVYEHYCKSKHTHETSLFIPSFSCNHHHHDHDHDCNKTTENTCCSKPPENSSDNCCTTSAKLFKLELPQIKINSSNKITVPILCLLLQSDFLLTHPQSEPQVQNITSLHLPPLILSGRDKRIHFQQLRISPPAYC